MDVELADPAPVSIDNLVAVLGLGMAGLAAYLVFTEIGNERGALGWTMLAAAFLALFPRMFLRIDVGAEAIAVDVMSGEREIPLAQIERARVVEGSLWPKLGAVISSRYYAGPFLLDGEADVTAYASRRGGPFVMLHRRGGRPVVLSPEDPAAFCQTVRRRIPT